MCYNLFMQYIIKEVRGGFYEFGLWQRIKI